MVGELLMVRQVDRAEIRRWRRRGFYSETVLVKLLERNGYKAVRVPVSNPSLSPLPDVIGRRDLHVYAFEVKNAKYYAYYPRRQVEKLFRFLDELVPIPNQYKHAVLGAHLGKKWIFKQVEWKKWEKNKLPEKDRIIKRDRGNFKLKQGS